jgi:beta-glucosidase
MYKEFGGRVKWWCTLNEPEVQTANSYVTGMFPPGGLGWLNTAGRVLRNLLICHVEIYYAIKEEAAAKGLEVKVGIVKDLFQFHSHRWHNLFDHFLAWQCNQLFNHQIIRFLKTGRFHYWVPFASSVSHFDERAPSANDFVGLNYYSKFMTNFSNVLFNSNLEEKLSVNQHEIISDMPQQAIYAEGLYSAIREMASIGHPVIVTENGIADASDTLRALYIRRYIYAMSRAIADGYPVAGYYYWALYDNFEWCLGYIPRFGLYHVDFDTQVRTLRPSAEHFTAIVKKFYEGELRTDKAGGGPEEQDTKPHVSAALVAVPQVSDEGGIELEDVPL